MPHTFSTEHLRHYSCATCHRWWSIADASPAKGVEMWCPWCGTKDSVQTEQSAQSGDEGK